MSKGMCSILQRRFSMWEAGLPRGGWLSERKLKNITLVIKRGLHRKAYMCAIWLKRAQRYSSFVGVLPFFTCSQSQKPTVMSNSNKRLFWLNCWVPVRSNNIIMIPKASRHWAKLSKYSRGGVAACVTEALTNIVISLAPFPWTKRGIAILWSHLHVMCTICLLYGCTFTWTCIFKFTSIWSAASRD